MQELAEGIWRVDSGQDGRRVCVSFGVHGNERPPIDAGLQLVERFRDGTHRLVAGQVLLVFANPRGAAVDQRWSEGGIDLNRCFHRDVLAREPERYEESRAREIADHLEAFGAEILVDFHCIVEPGSRFLMQHPPVDDAGHRDTYRLLAAEVLLSDPDLNFGSVSLDEYMSTRGRVGICYETGWIQDPANTPEFVCGEMENVLRGTGLLDGDPVVHGDKTLLQLDEVLRCEGEGFRWRDGVGENLQVLAADTVLGTYADGREVSLPWDATLIFPKKKPELVEMGKPLVYLGRAMNG